MRLVASVLVFFYYIFFSSCFQRHGEQTQRFFYVVITIFNKINNTGVEELMHGG